MVGVGAKVPVGPGVAVPSASPTAGVGSPASEVGEESSVAVGLRVPGTPGA